MCDCSSTSKFGVTVRDLVSSASVFLIFDPRALADFGFFIFCVAKPKFSHGQYERNLGEKYWNNGNWLSFAFDTRFHIHSFIHLKQCTGTFYNFS